MTIVSVLPNNMAVVSTEGLYRVEECGTGEVIAELLEQMEADRLVRYFRKTFNRSAKMIPYAKLEPQSPAVNRRPKAVSA